MVKTQGREPYRGTDTRVRPYYWDMESPILPTFPVWDITEAGGYENEQLDINSLRGNDSFLTEEDGEWYEVTARGTNTETWRNLKTGYEEVRLVQREKPRTGRRTQDPYNFRDWMPREQRFFWETPTYQSETGYVHFEKTTDPNKPTTKEPRPKRPKGKPTDQEARDQAKADKERLRNMRPKTSPSPEEPPVTKTTRVMWMNADGVWTYLPASMGDGFSL